MERRFPKSPLLHEDAQSGCSWAFRSVFEFIFHKHSARKLLSNTNRFNRSRFDNSIARKKIDTFRAAKVKFWDGKAESVKPNKPFSPPSSRTRWPSMLKESNTNGTKNPNTIDKDSRSTLRGTFHHYLHLNVYGCKNIDVVDSEAIKNRRRARKIKRFRGFKTKRIVLSWKRTRLRKNLLLKNSRIVALEPINETGSYFSFKRWIDKLKRPEHEKTSSSSVLDSKETNNRKSKSIRDRRKRNLGVQVTPYRNCLADAQVHEVVPCTTSFHFEESIDNTDKHNEEHNEDSSESSLDCQEPSSLNTKEPENSVHSPPNLQPHELDPIHDYVKSVITAAGLEWDELLMSCQVSDQLLIPTLYQQIKFKSGGSDTESLILFDYVNEILLEVYCHHTTKLGFFLAEEDVAREAMRCIDWDLVLRNRARTLEQVVKKDLAKFGSWLDDRTGEEDVVVEVVEGVLEDLIEEIYAD